MDAKSHHQYAGQRHSALIQELLNCAMTCEACSAACLAEENVSMARAIQLNRDCTEICLLTARLLQRDSEISSSFLMTCVDICYKCEEECKKHSHEHCQQCAEACKSCASACRSRVEHASMQEI